MAAAKKATSVVREHSSGSTRECDGCNAHSGGFGVLKKGVLPLVNSEKHVISIQG
jgi:hypothetical protein